MASLRRLIYRAVSCRNLAGRLGLHMHAFEPGTLESLRQVDHKAKGPSRAERCINKSRDATLSVSNDEGRFFSPDQVQAFLVQGYRIDPSGKRGSALDGRGTPRLAGHIPLRPVQPRVLGRGLAWCEDSSCAEAGDSSDKDCYGVAQPKQWKNGWLYMTAVEPPAA